MNRILAPSLALATLAAWPAAAMAASPSITIQTVNLRAGPGTQFPVLVALPARAPLTIIGCNLNVSWCDVAWGRSRGWVAASMIQVIHAGQPAVVTPAVAASAGLAVVAFSRAYWATHYVGQPWYGTWHRYYRAPYAAPAPVHRVGGVACGPEACRYGTVRRGPYGTTVRYGRFERR